MAAQTEIELMQYCCSAKFELAIDAHPIFVHFSVAELQEQGYGR